MEFNFFGNKFDINIRHQEKNIDKLELKKFMINTILESLFY